MAGDLISGAHFNRLIRLSIWLAAVAFAGHAKAQQYSFRAYGVEQGLTNLGLKSLYQDRQGFLWASTENGVFRYDGERFQSFAVNSGLPFSSAMAFGESPDGSLLVGGEAGLFRKAGEKFEKIPMPGANAVSWFSGIQSDGKGTTWLSTETGLLVMTRAVGDAQFTFRSIPKAPILDSPATYGLLVEKGEIWYGCDKQLCRLLGSEVTVFGAREGLPPSKWKAIRRGQNGDLWVQGRSMVALLPLGGKRFRTQESQFRNNGTTGILSKDTAGNIIIGTNDGLDIRDGASWKSVGRNSGLRGSVYCALEDREGSLWIGLLGRGLVRWVGYREWEAFTTDSGLGSDVVYQVLPLADGSVWAGTESGLFHGQKNHDVWTWRGQPQFSRIAVHSVRPDRSGRLWLGTESRGAARFTPATGAVEWFTEKQGLGAKSPFTLSLDSRNRIWAATEHGLFMSDAETVEFHPIKQVPVNSIWSVVEAANGDIWVGSADGLFRLVGSDWSHLTTSDGLSHKVVLALAAAKNGDVWVGYRYGGGLDRIHMDGRMPRVVQPPNNPGNNPGNNPEGNLATVYFLGFDRRQRLWAGTDRGLDVWDANAWVHYDRRDGLVWDDCDLNGFGEGADGSVWIGTSGGLARFTPHATPARNYAPDVIYTRLALGDKEVDPSANPSVEHASNMLHARFSAPTFARESSVVFRYRLTPLVEGWRETEQHELQFDGLRPGSYRLEVLARDGWGNWSTHPTVFQFQILAAWWQGPWLLAILLFVPLAVVTLLSRLRGSAMRRRETLLVGLVEDRTAELQRANQDLLQLSRLEHDKNLAEEQRVHAEEVAQLNRRAIETLALAIEAKDHTTHDHLQRVEVYARGVGKELGLDECQLEALGAAALLHDVGKLGVPDYIISKPGRLTPEEYEKMKTHTVVGAEIVEQIRFPYPVAPLVRSHHEKWDGCGYPDGLAGEQIPIGARILAAVDCLDALASDRQYRRALPVHEAIHIVISEAGKSFDPAVVEALARTYVELERMAKASCSVERTKLSTDLIIARGEAPAAGFQTAAAWDSLTGDLANLSNSLAETPEPRQALVELTRQIARCEDRAAAFATLSRSLRYLVPYDLMAVYLRQGDILIPESSEGENHRLFASLDIPVGTGLSGWVAENRKPSLNGNPAVEPGYLKDPIRFGALQSALAVPLLSGEPDSAELVVGVLSLYRKDCNAFNPEHLARLTSIGVALAQVLVVTADQAMVGA